MNNLETRTAIQKVLAGLAAKPLADAASEFFAAIG
jgi:hypothetical protein